MRPKVGDGVSIAMALPPAIFRGLQKAANRSLKSGPILF
jgi:hypothetical protein